MEKRVLALDFGASSARAMSAVTDGTTLTVEELHRWDNVPIEKNGHLYWDIDTLFHEICISLKRAAQAGGVDAIGIDTWGVDFGLLDENGHLLENPVHYDVMHVPLVFWNARCPVCQPKRSTSIPVSK